MGIPGALASSQFPSTRLAEKFSAKAVCFTRVRNGALSFPELLFAVFYKLKKLSLLLKHLRPAMRSDFGHPWLQMALGTIQTSQLM